MSELPTWVWDILRDLAEQKDHPKLLFESGAFEGTRKYDWCPCATLAKAPTEVVEQARVMNRYIAQKAAELAKRDKDTEVCR